MNDRPRCSWSNTASDSVMALLTDGDSALLQQLRSMTSEHPLIAARVMNRLAQISDALLSPCMFDTIWILQ